MNNNLIKKFKKTPYLGRIIAVALLVVVSFVVGWSVNNFMTPYHEPKTEAVFYIAEEQDNSKTIVRAEVISDNEAKVIDGNRKGQVVELDFSRLSVDSGDVVLLTAAETGTAELYAFQTWRLPGVVMLSLVLIVAVVAIGGARGMASLGGLIFSVAVVGLYIVPAILSGADAFLVCISAAYVIAFVSLFIAHGFSYRTIISILAVSVVLFIVILLSMAGSHIGHLTGVYDETSSILAMGGYHIDMYGVLLGGIVIATLGVLDDIVTTQVAAVDEINKADKKLGVKQLFLRGHSIGNEHIAALINTLALVYIGISLPTVLSIASNVNLSDSPLLIMNMEYIAQEIVRTIVSSLGLVLAVPISTGLAAFLIYHKPQIVAIMRKRKNGGG